MDALKRSAANAKALSEDYLDSVIAGLEDHRIPFTDDVEQFEDQFFKSIERFVPTKNELIELFSSLARHASSQDASEVIAKFFEKLAPFHLVPDNVSRYRRGDFDNFKFISNELFLSLIAVLVKREKFDVIASVLNATYYQPGRHGSQGTVDTFTIFAGFLDSLEHRNQRLRLGRVSLKADYLQERCTGTPVKFPEIIQADLILYIRSQFDALTTKHSRGRWYPHTIIYAASFSGAFEIFVRATSKQYFEKIKLMFGVDDPETFKTLLAEVGSINSNYDRISLRELCNADDIASR